MSARYHPFQEARPLVQFVGQAGADIGGLLLSPAGYQAIAESKTTGLPCELVAVGEDIGPDGERRLRYAATREYIEATTDWRWDAGTRRLRLLCPLCGLRDGKHRKSCEW
jgi:hypothetical protein